MKTDDGEFSMEMPAGCYSQSYVSEGITLYRQKDSFRLKEMRSITCYHEKTLLSADIFHSDEPKTVVKLLKEREKLKAAELNLEKPFYGFEQVVSDKNFSSTKRLIAGKNHVYIITAGTRGAPGETMQRFLQSLKFSSNPSADDAAGKAVLISSLKNVLPEFVDETNEKRETIAAVTDEAKKPATTTQKNLIILRKVSPSYSNAARKKNVNGRIALRVNFGANAVISKIEVVRGLPDGLVREAVLAVMQMKFLPAEQDDVPRSVTRTIEFSFKIY